MTLIRPRLNDHFGLPFTQHEVDFAIPLLDEDIPLYVDPFLLWKSPSFQDNSLHTAVVSSFNHLGYLFNNGRETEAIRLLIRASECNEVGLGNSKSRIGKPIGEGLALSVLNLFKAIPQIEKSGFIHFEEIQLLVDNVSRDRVSDITCTFLKSWLIDYTIDQCKRLNIPLAGVDLEVFDYKSKDFVAEKTDLPVNPENGRPVILVPRRWLRALPWINLDDYVNSFFVKRVLKEGEGPPERIEILNFNRRQYDVLCAYVKHREGLADFCSPDPLYRPISVSSAKGKLKSILKLPTGKSDSADKKFESYTCQLLSSAFYPQLDFAAEQCRTDSGVLIRDLIFYNNRTHAFLKDIYDDFGSRQLVFELKNVREIDREHVNQLNRYMSAQFGRFGVLVTRNRAPRAVYKNTINLWSGQRRCILVLHDEDLKMITTLYESRSRLPIDVLNKKYLEFTRDCPA